MERTVIHIRIHNASPRVVERVRLNLQYFKTGAVETAGQVVPPRHPLAKWVFGMPRKEWNLYQLCSSPDATYDHAEPLPPGKSYEFSLVHYGGGAHRWWTASMRSRSRCAG